MPEARHKAKASHTKPTTIHHHFSRIAQRYHYLRTTDTEPIILLAGELRGLTHIEGLDIGCGAGRYDLLLYRYLGEKLRLTCVDANVDMLNTLERNLKEQGISNFASLPASAENLPFQGNTFDFVCTFNAIHHFNLPVFLRECARIVKTGGHFFIYTRFPEQNRRNIWGQYFPGFHQKETRLYTPETLTKAVAATPNLRIESIEYFKYGRISTLSELLKRARAHHYSTFSLYSPGELKEAIAGFSQKIGEVFEDTHQIHWYDENVLFIIREVS